MVHQFFYENILNRRTIWLNNNKKKININIDINIVK